MKSIKKFSTCDLKIINYVIEVCCFLINTAQNISQIENAVTNMLEDIINSFNSKSIDKILIEMKILVKLSNYESIRDILEKDDYQILKLMTSIDISKQLFQQFFKKSYNHLLNSSESKSFEKIYKEMGLKKPESSEKIKFRDIIHLNFLKEIPSLKCYDLYFKELSKKEKVEKETLFQSIFKNIDQKFYSFDYLNFLRFFLLNCDSKFMKEKVFKQLSARLIDEMKKPVKDPFIYYFFCEIGLNLFAFKPKYFKDNFLNDFFKIVLKAFDNKNDQKFMAVISDLIDLYKENFENNQELKNIIKISSKSVMKFFSKENYSKKNFKKHYKSSEFLELLSNNDESIILI